MKNHDSCCSICGGLIARPGKVYGTGGTFCNCPDYDYSPSNYIQHPLLPQFTFTLAHEHCYCQKETVQGIEHKKCCICGQRMSL